MGDAILSFVVTENLLLGFEFVAPHAGFPAPSMTATSLADRSNPSAFVASLPPDAQQSVPALLAQALHAFRASHYADSSSFFRRLYSLHPHCLDGADVYSTVLWHLKDERGLAQLSRQAVELAPSRAEAWIVSGNLASIRRDSDAAISFFGRAARLDASCAYALSLAGSESVLTGALEQAGTFFRQALDRDPREWTAWYGLGSVHCRRNHFAPAEYYMRRALDENPDSAVLHGLMLRKCGRTGETEAEFDAALALEPANVAALLEKARLLAESGKGPGMGHPPRRARRR
jgi:anaphase-promoting complex subunit 3